VAGSGQAWALAGFGTEAPAHGGTQGGSPVTPLPSGSPSGAIASNMAVRVVKCLGRAIWRTSRRYNDASFETAGHQNLRVQNDTLH